MISQVMAHWILFDTSPPDYSISFEHPQCRNESVANQLSSTSVVTLLPVLRLITKKRIMYARFVMERLWADFVAVVSNLLRIHMSYLKQP